MITRDLRTLDRAKIIHAITEFIAYDWKPYRQRSSLLTVNILLEAINMITYDLRTINRAKIIRAITEFIVCDWERPRERSILRRRKQGRNYQNHRSVYSTRRTNSQRRKKA
jgi:hypothetical protein